MLSIKPGARHTRRCWYPGPAEPLWPAMPCRARRPGFISRTQLRGATRPRGSRRGLLFASAGIREAARTRSRGETPESIRSTAVVPFTMALRPKIACLAAVAAVLVASCTATPSAPRGSDRATASARSTASPGATALTVLRPVDVALTPALQDIGEWTELFRVPWGPDTEALGVSDDHDAQASRLGPDGAAPTSRGTWWFTDTHKLRLVEVDQTGRYQRHHPVPGQHMDASLLHVFDDGAMWAPSGRIGRNGVWAADGDGPALRADVVYPDTLGWTDNDGRAAYGRANDGRSYRLHVTADGPEVERVEWWRTRDGRRFLPRLDLGARRATIDLPDAPVPASVELRFSYAGDQDALQIYAETRAGNSGRIHLLVAGIVDAPKPLALATLVTVEPDGRVGAPVPVPFFMTDSDMGSRSHLQVEPLGGSPALVVNRDDHTVVLRSPRGS
jgi:hypothetical protein